MSSCIKNKNLLIAIKRESMNIDNAYDKTSEAHNQSILKFQLICYHKPTARNICYRLLYFIFLSKIAITILMYTTIQEIPCRL